MSKEEIYKLKRKLESLIHQNASTDKISEVNNKLDEALEKFLYENLKNTTPPKK
ncbi:hypothetical protein ACFHWD_09245 [Clostridium sp. MT-14]|uniref:hypothetical protein n=1 Tax=unclassified Clostridium TaxID=2614128 RepID=UPI00156CC102|nr:hypothetical protein [Clostridium sp. HV4-5-A1G]CAB1248262.1 conserved hypothetical protein [Clostridiaceae bacterium BL-3]